MDNFKNILENPKEALQQVFKKMGNFPHYVSEDRKNNSLIDFFVKFSEFDCNLIEEIQPSEITSLKNVIKTSKFEDFARRMFKGEQILNSYKYSVWVIYEYVVLFSETDRCLSMACFKQNMPDSIFFAVSCLWDETGEDEIYIHITTSGQEDKINKICAELCTMYLVKYKM